MGDDGSRGIKVISDHFEGSASIVDSPQARTPSTSHPRINNPSSLRELMWGSGTDGQEKVVLTSAEVQSLRSTVAYLEEREAHLKAQLENVDQILRSAQLSGYLFIRSRWATLPGEPPPLDDTEVDDWLPRFLVLHGSCIFFYLFSTGRRTIELNSSLSSNIPPLAFGTVGMKIRVLKCFQSTGKPYNFFSFYVLINFITLLSAVLKAFWQVVIDVFIEVVIELAAETWISKGYPVVDLWLMTLQGECKLGHERKAIADSRKT
ncbi:hypothetical protein RHMOL_Rhmol02G0303700 [Rhododendron molle]|uniref:Uncharacterized protein n=1 Tax=Rhododendron molle TaxID=49168 RepID=A0ACC0PXM3_RHOML|nr:hypothetical protein RHMOL_Rhmol02G0303700 [Rhododendron molle]